MFTRKVSSTTVSRTASMSERSSLDVERISSATQAMHLTYPTQRTMSLEEEDDDEEESPWEALRASAGPMSAVSETGSGVEAFESLELAQNVEVKILRISNLSRGCTASQIYSAFKTEKDGMRIEVQSSDEALLHFPSSDQAMKAYFTYLSSTSSIGTVSPYEAGTDSFSSSPVKQVPQPLRSRRSFQSLHNGSNGGMLSALSNISSWRSSDKLNNLNTSQSDKDSRFLHRRTSSRNSIHCPSSDRLSGMTKIVNTTSLGSDSTAQHSREAQNHARSGTTKSNTPLSQSTVPESTIVEPRATKSTSTAKKLFTLGFGFKTSKTPKEKDEKQLHKSTKTQIAKGKQELK